MLLELSHEHGGSITFDALGKMRTLVPAAKLFAWRDKDDPFFGGRFHAKVAVADGKMMLHHKCEPHWARHGKVVLPLRDNLLILATATTDARKRSTIVLTITRNGAERAKQVLTLDIASLTVVYGANGGGKTRLLLEVARTLGGNDKFKQLGVLWEKSGQLTATRIPPTISSARAPKMISRVRLCWASLPSLTVDSIAASLRWRKFNPHRCMKRR